MATTGGTGERLTLTISAAAKELGVSSDTILRWFEAGYLPIFVPPGRNLDDIKPAWLLDLQDGLGIVQAAANLRGWRSDESARS
jgi:excisionase family DNA binding protein